MSISISTALKNAGLDAFEVASMVFKYRSGAAPGIGNADSGTALVSISCPADGMAAASGGSKAKTGTWAGLSIATGTIGHYRLYASNGTTVLMEGSVTASGGGGDMIVDSVTVSSVGLLFAVEVFTWDIS